MSAKSFLHPHVLKAVKTNLVDSPSNRGFIEAVEDATQFLDDQPARFSFRFHLRPVPQLMGMTRVEAFSEALREIYGWLGFMSFGTTYRTRELLSGIVTGLNETRYTLAMLASRALLELAAVWSPLPAQIAPQLENLDQLDSLPFHTANADTRIAQNYARIIWEPWDAIRRLLTKGRFNWELALRHDAELFTKYREVPEARRQAKLTRLIGNLRFDGPVPPGATPQFWYAILSEFVHPDPAASVMNVDRAEPEGPNSIRFALAATPSENSDLAQVTVNVIGIPVRESLRITKDCITSLRNLMDEHGHRLQRLGIYRA